MGSRQAGLTTGAGSATANAAPSRGRVDRSDALATQIVLLIGTTKGIFTFRSNEGRRDWQMTGPHLGGWEVYSLLGDSRDGPRILAGTHHQSGGATIQVSEDFGANWRPVEEGPRFPPQREFDFQKFAWVPGESGEPRQWTMRRIWQLVPGHASQPDTFYAGCEDASLFVSHDRGETWREVDALTKHPTRPQWGPGAGGMGLHTILVDPDNARRIWVAASSVGVFRTDNGGETWVTRNKGLNRVATDGDDREVGFCAHKIALDPNASNVMYMQDHGGVNKSVDGGDTWFPIEEGLGAEGDGRFGFPICVSQCGDLYLMPLKDSEQRVMRGGKMLVYQSIDRGESWHPVAGDFLPTSSYVNVLRDGMAVDSLDPYGVYFGTSSGELFYSLDRGDSWSSLPGRFPRITTVKTWMLES